MARKQVGMIDGALLDRVDAARGDASRVKFVERALEATLSGARQDVAPHEVPGARPDGPASPRASVAATEALTEAASSPSPAPKPFRCSYSTCSFRTPSPKAVCPVHGRRVVER